MRRKGGEGEGMGYEGKGIYGMICKGKGGDVEGEEGCGRKGRERGVEWTL